MEPSSHSLAAAIRARLEELYPGKVVELEGGDVPLGWFDSYADSVSYESEVPVWSHAPATANANITYHGDDPAVLRRVEDAMAGLKAQGKVSGFVSVLMMGSDSERIKEKGGEAGVLWTIRVAAHYTREFV